MIMEHEDFIEKYFTQANEAALCAALDATDLENALDAFEDTRAEFEVNDMLAKMQHIVGKWTWSDDLGENGAYFN